MYNLRYQFLETALPGLCEKRTDTGSFRAVDPYVAQEWKSLLLMLQFFDYYY